MHLSGSTLFHDERLLCLLCETPGHISLEHLPWSKGLHQREEMRRQNDLFSSRTKPAWDCTPIIVGSASGLLSSRSARCYVKRVKTYISQGNPQFLRVNLLNMTSSHCRVAAGNIGSNRDQHARSSGWRHLSSNAGNWYYRHPQYCQTSSCYTLPHPLSLAIHLLKFSMRYRSLPAMSFPIFTLFASSLHEPTRSTNKHRYILKLCYSVHHSCGECTYPIQSAHDSRPPISMKRPFDSSSSSKWNISCMYVRASACNDVRCPQWNSP